MNAIKEHDYIKFYEKEIEFRKNFEYPPFIDILLIELYGKDLDLLKNESNKFYSILSDENSKNIYKVFSPKSPYIEKINNKFRVNIIIKCKFSSIFLKKIYEKFAEYDKIRLKSINVSITKNPIFIG